MDDSCVPGHAALFFAEVLHETPATHPMASKLRINMKWPSVCRVSKVGYSGSTRLHGGDAQITITTNYIWSLVGAHLQTDKEHTEL